MRPPATRHDREPSRRYPSATHQNQPKPYQKPLTCTADGGVLEFPGSPGLRVCYKYQFGKVTDQAVAHPCGIPLNEVDVLLAYRPKTEAVQNAPSLRSGAVNVASVDGTYQDALVSQLKNAFRRLRLPPPSRDYPRAHPQQCARADVHFANPGVPDYAIEAWLGWLASGLADDSRPGGRAGGGK